MTGWVSDLREKAGKAEPSWDEPAFDVACWEYVESCLPARVRALCELAEAAQARLAFIEKGYDEGRNASPAYFLGHELWQALAALASLEPARKEET